MMVESLCRQKAVEYDERRWNTMIEYEMEYDGGVRQKAVECDERRWNTMIEYEMEYDGGVSLSTKTGDDRRHSQRTSCG